MRAGANIREGGVNDDSGGGGQRCLCLCLLFVFVNMLGILLRE